MSISPQRLRLALEQLSENDGFLFERFANEFLASELDSLRPVAGMHDGGRDAFVYQAGDLESVFCQHSVTSDWPRKIKDTIKILRMNGFSPRELIYCSNRDILRHADGLRSQLRSDGISLDIRDRAWFEAVANSSPARIDAAERLARQVVDPLLASREIIGSVCPSLTQEEERVAATYLQLELGRSDSAKGTTRVCIEALVKYALRENSPEQPLPRGEVHNRVLRHASGAHIERTKVLADSALKRLAERGAIKFHQKQDSFTLAFPERKELSARIEQVLFDNAALVGECSSRAEHLIGYLGVDFECDPVSIAKDALLLLDHEICDRGRLAALALTGAREFAARRRSVEEVARDLLQRKMPFVSLSSLGNDRFMDLIPPLAEEIASHPSELVAARLRRASDAYCLQFIMQQTPDIQGALGKIIAGTSLLVDTSVIVPCMAEHLLQPAQRRVTNLLKGAAAMGCTLFVGDDVLNEIETHLNRVVYTYRNSGEVLLARLGHASADYFAPAIIRAYVEASTCGTGPGTFEEYVAMFLGHVSPRLDLIEYLREELSIKFDEMQAERNAIPPADLGTLYEEWKQKKTRRPWIDSQAHETLVLHDARAFLLIEQLRRRHTTAPNYGHKWWWLVQDGNAFRFDRERRDRSGGGYTCMSPDFFSRYLSIAPKPASMSNAYKELLPACLEIASLGFIPPELREQALQAYESTRDLPEYLRRRKLRDLVNSCFVKEEVLDDETSTE